MDSDLSSEAYLTGESSSSCPYCRTAVANSLDDIPFQELVFFEEAQDSDDESVDELDEAESTDAEEEEDGGIRRVVFATPLVSPPAWLAERAPTPPARLASPSRRLAEEHPTPG